VSAKQSGSLRSFGSEFYVIFDRASVVSLFMSLFSVSKLSLSPSIHSVTTLPVMPFAFAVLLAQQQSRQVLLAYTRVTS